MRHVTYNWLLAADGNPARHLGWRHMLERYRTLGAVLALGEFSVPELAHLAGVRESSVRTILRRESDYVEQIGRQATGRPGGKPIRWRLRPAARERLRALLHDLERLGSGPWLDERLDDGPGVPASILAAEDVLLRLVPAAATPAERAELVKLAETQLDTASASFATMLEGPLDDSDRESGRHRHVVELLIGLARAELTVGQPEQWPMMETRELLMDLLLAAGLSGDRSLADAVKIRVERSLLWRPAAAPGRPGIHVSSPAQAIHPQGSQRARAGVASTEAQIPTALPDRVAERGFVDSLWISWEYLAGSWAGSVTSAADLGVAASGARSLDRAEVGVFTDVAGYLAAGAGWCERAASVSARIDESTGSVRALHRRVHRETVNIGVIGRRTRARAHCCAS